MKITLGEGLQEHFNRRHGTNSDEFATLEDFGDRLNSFYTTVIILILASIAMTSTYFLRPISCTLSSQASNPFGTYVESVCWVQGTTGLNRDDRIPSNSMEWDQLREKSNICESFNLMF